MVGLGASLLGATLGSLIGVASAYFGGRVDLVVQRIMDVFFAFPVIILALAVVAVLGTGAGNVILAIATPMVPRCASCRERARRPRDAVRRRRARLRLRPPPHHPAPYAAERDGADPHHGDRVPRRAILLEASLSFLGLGVQEPTAAWGLMLRGAAVQFAESAPWMAIFPGSRSALACSASISSATRCATLDPRLRTQ